MWPICGLHGGEIYTRIFAHFIYTFPHLLDIITEYFKEFDLDASRWNKLRQQETFMNKSLEYKAVEFRRSTVLLLPF